MNMKILFFLSFGFANGVYSFSLEDSFQSALYGDQLLWAGLLAVFAGFLTSLSPCVYPLIPITLSIMGTRHVKSRLHGLSIASVYVSGMMLLYSTLSIFFVSFGWLAGSVLQSPWIIGCLACIFIFLALNMFHAFDFVVPQSVMNRVSRHSGSEYSSIFAMGLFSGVIAAPCTGPILTFILTLVGSKGDIFRGAFLMLLYSFGLGIPFLILGTFSSFIGRIPKGGPWMNRVKNVFGVVMLSAALYYLQFIWAWLYDFLIHLRTLGLPMLIILICISLTMGALRFSFKSKLKTPVFIQGFGVLLLAFSLSGLATPLIVYDSLWTIVAKNDQSLTLFQRKIDEAKFLKKPVVIDFYADWCVSCKELEQNTYADIDVKKAMKRFVLIKVDVTHESKMLNELQKRFGVVGLPTVLFIDSQGILQSSLKIFGFIKAKEFLKYLESIK
jgi:thioredoxin:protein disulfide reductase